MQRRLSPARSAFGVVGFLVVMEFGSGALQGWFSPLLAAIGRQFDVGAGALNWVNAMYMLVTVACVPILAKLGDMFGHKRLLVVASALVAVGSLVVAFAPSFEIFLVGRALQAPLAAFLPLEFAIVRARDERSASRSIGVLVGALTLGAAVGSLASGLLFGAIGDLTVVLLVPAVFVALCVPVVILLVPETVVRKRGRVDVIGAILLTAGLLAVLTGISNAGVWGWGDVRTIVLLVGGAALLLSWVVVERRIADPLVDLTMLTRGGIGLPIVASLLFGAQTYGGQTASFLWLLGEPARDGYGLGIPPAAAGAIIVLYALAAFVGTLLGDRLARRISAARAIALAGAVAAASFALMIGLAQAAALFIAAMAVGGVSAGVLLAVLPAVVVRNAPADSVGIASALFNTARTAAGAAAGAVFALVMSLFVVAPAGGGAAGDHSAPSSFFAVWAICLVIALVLAVVGMRIRVGPPAQEPHDSGRAVTEPVEER
ncbi:MFS transporter [Leifsonia shinshuensis]|uniref:MFS transporter n=1 Tax=Leifsonia shinshuensis TaxID=150026 RepID=UPI001F51233F|nr:MFS transporter [Leifsonia shinshuensis]MCI0157797.1 MFS transporter [Leifsonia shinshuensis]